MGGHREHLRSSAAFSALIYIFVFLWSLFPIPYSLFPAPPAPPAHADISRDFNTGVYLYKKGDYELAAKTFEIILTEFPGDSRTDEVMYWYGESSYQLGNYTDALGMYKKLAAEYPKSKFTLKAMFSAGYAAMKLDLYKDAIAFFSDVLADPAVDKNTIVETRIVLAECYLKLGDDKESERALRDILTIPKLSAEKKLEVEFELGRLLIRIGRPAEGRAIFARVAEKSGVHQADALMALGDASYNEGEYRESLEWYEKIFRKVRGVKPEYRARAIYNGAWSYLGLGELDKARSLFNEVFEDKSALPEVRGDAALRLAYLHRDRGSGKAADEMAAAAEKIADESKQARLRDDVLLFRAESAFLQKKFDESLAYLARVADKGYRVHRLTGQIFFESGRPADAALYFDRAAGQAPHRDAAHLCLFDLAQSHFSAANYDSALAAITRIKDPSEALEFRLKPFRADVSQQAGRFKEAAKQYEQLAAQTPDTRTAQRYRYFAAHAYFRGKNFINAGRTLDQFFEVHGSAAALAGDSVAASALILRADVLAEQGKSEEAQAAYLRAIPAAEAVGPDNVFLAYSHLIDFAVKYAKAGVVEHSDALISALGDTRSYAFIIDRQYASGQYKNLLKYTDAVIREFPPAADIYGRAAYYEMMAHYKRDQLDDAVKSMETLNTWVAAHPAADIAEEAHFWRARLAQMKSDRPSAKSAYLSYLDFHPTGKYVSEALFNIGLICLDDEQPADAERAFMKLLDGKSEETIESNTLLADARYNMASVRILQSRYEEAAAILEPLGRMPAFKSDPAYLYKLGYVKVFLNRPIEGEAHFRDALAKPKVQGGTLDNILYALFSLLYRAERYDQLEADFKRYSERIQSKAIAAKAKYMMGMTLFDAERFLEAIPYFKSVRPPADTEIVIESAMRIADCDYNLKRYKSALDRYTKISTDVPSTRWGREAMYAAGLCKIKLGFPESALTGFERFLQENPDEPLARDVAMEAARLYLSRSDIAAAEQKLDFLDRHKVEGPFVEESMRMRIKIWQKRGDADKVLTLARSYRGAYGANAEIALSAAEAAIKLNRPQDAIQALDGFGNASLDTNVRGFMDFYRAEAFQKLGDEGAVDIYKRLADFPDTEIQLSSRFRYGVHLLDKKDYAAARGMFVSVITNPAGKLMPFFQQALMNAFTAAKLAGEPSEIVRLNEKFKSQVPDEKNKIAVAEFHLWARLALKDNSKSLSAATDLLSLNLDPRRRTEVLLTVAQLHEALKSPDKADAVYTGLLNNPGVAADQRMLAESRKVQHAISLGPAGREILEKYLNTGPQGEWASRAAEALLASAVEERRYADIIRTVDLIQAMTSLVRPSARYASGIARLALSDTPGALADFRTVADEASPETFYIAWSAYRVAQDEMTARRLTEAKKYLRTAWKQRANLDSPAALNTYQQLAEILFESADYDGMQAIVGDPPPEGLPSEPHLLKGLVAWATKDYASAARHLREVSSASDQIRMLYAESLAKSGAVPLSIAEYKRLADGHGEVAARAQMTASDLLDQLGKSSESLIGYYKVLAVYESDTGSEVAAEALLRIARLYAKIGDAQKSKTAATDLINKYPQSRPAKEAAGMAEGR